MNPARLTDLIYGHVGEPVYDSKSHKWHFSRIPLITRQLKPLGQPSTILPPSTDHTSLGNLQLAADRTQNIKNLTRSFPELVPGISLLPKLAQVSEVVNELTSHHDPILSTLLAFGKAKTERPKHLKRRSKPPDVPIAAVVGGSAGEAVRLFQLKEEFLGWGEKDHVGLKVLRPMIEEQCWWIGNGTPIQQVCFGEAKGDSTSWLAIRYHGATTILQPSLRSGAFPVKPTHGSNSKLQCFPSRLDSNPVITLPIQQTGGFSHVDISFSIGDALQFALVDQQGHWSIWKLKAPNTSSRTWTVNAGPKGKIFEDTVDNGSKTTNYDGWGAIIWLDDDRLIVVADRKSLSFFKIEEPLKKLAALDLNLTKNSDWILDMKKSPSDDTNFLVATSTRVFWLRLVSPDSKQAIGDPSSGASILLSWRHFRDEGDTSLKMNVLHDEKTTMVVLYSRLTSYSTVFTFGFSQSLTDFPQSLSDPYILSLEARDYSGYTLADQDHSYIKSRPISNLVLTRICYESQTRWTASGLGSRYQADGVKFFNLTTLHNDMSLRQRLYVGLSPTKSIHVESPGHQRRKYPPKSQTRVVDEVVENDFIVPHWYPVDIGPLSQSAESDDVEIKSLSTEEDPWTLDFEWLGKSLRGDLPQDPDFQDAHSRAPFEQCLDLIRSAILEKLAARSPGVESMLELLDLNPSVLDIDAASNMLSDLLISINDISVPSESGERSTSKSNALISNLFVGQVYKEFQLRPEIDEKTLMSRIYDSLMTAWISPLSNRIPGRIRVVVEKNIREIAAQICLASLGIHLNPIALQDEDIDGQPSPEHDGTLNLPLRRKSSFQKRSVQRGAKSAERSSSPLASSHISEDVGFMPASAQASQALPTPEMTPSLRSRSSVASLGESEDPACQRLKALAKLASQPALPIPASNILRQWSIGADPANFDWEAVQQDLDAENPSEDEASIPKAKKRRRDKKLRKRKSDIDLASSSQTTATTVRASQQPPVLNTSIQPPQRLGLHGSSQLAEHGVEIGRIQPGRNSSQTSRSKPEKKKKQKKKPGF